MAKKVYIGADNFTKRELPSGYTQVQYIESNETQYVDTGFVPNQNTRVVMRCQLTESSGVYWLFGARKSSKTQSYGVYWYGGYTNTFGSDYGAERISFADEADATKIIIIDLNKNTAIVDDSEESFSATTFESPCALALLACNTNGTIAYNAPAKLYSCQIYDNGTLVRDFVPCKNTSGTIGLYDLVNNVFYTNAGSGTFTAGAVYAEDVAMNVKNIYLSVEAVAREITSGYIGVDGIARQFWAKGGKALGELTVGETVYMNVNGVSTEFIVVNQGAPSSDYDSSCDGTWLLMKDLYEKRVWDSSDNDYQNSDIHTYLNGTFLGLLDSDIQHAIKQIKLPCQKGTGYAGSVSSGANGLSTKVFLLSGYEVGWTTGNSSYFPVDGVCLDYFSGTSATDSKRIGYYNGTATRWWLRSPSTNDSSYVWNVNISGKYYRNTYTDSLGVRPALVLPSDATVDDDYNVIPPPLTLGALHSGDATSYGDTVYLNVNGISTEFMVVQQGLPSSDYDSSCDGTWLLMLGCYGSRAISSVYNNYAASDMHTYLNGTFLDLLDSDIANAIKQVKIPYVNGNGSSGAVATDSNGLSTKVFLLSGTELGLSASTMKTVGAVLDNFATAEDMDRMPNGTNSSEAYWLRDPYTGDNNRMNMAKGGAYSYDYSNYSHYVRPCIILPSNTKVDDSYKVTP